MKPADLKQLSHDKDLIRSDRTTVINEVKKLTKVPIQRKPVTLVAVKKAWKSFRKTALPNLLELTPEDRTEFFTDMEASLSQFRNDAFEDEDGEGMEVNENQEAESSAQGEASEEPAEDEQAEEGEGEGTHPDQRASEDAAKQPEAPPEFQPPAKTEEPAKPLAAKQKEHLPRSNQSAQHFAHLAACRQRGKEQFYLFHAGSDYGLQINGSQHRNRGDLRRDAPSAMAFW